METNDLTVKHLQEIRDEQRGTRADLKEMNERFNKRFEQMDKRFEEVNERFREVNERFEIIETTLRDLAQQMVMLASGVNTAIEIRSDVDRRITEIERGLEAVEKPTH